MARETAGERLKRAHIKRVVINHIAILERATNVAWQALTPTRVNCPHCQNPYFPRETPEYAAWSAAHAAEERAICAAVERGDIPENDACVRFGLSIETIRNGIVIYNLTKAREERDAHGQGATTGEGGAEQETTGTPGGA